MEKIELGTPEGTAENIDKIAELFPQVVTEVENGEGTLERTVDFDALRDLWVMWPKASVNAISSLGPASASLRPRRAAPSKRR